MFKGNEIIGFLLTAGIGIFLAIHWHRVKVLPEAKLFFASYYVYFAGVLATNLEVLCFPNFLNCFEHFCYALNALLILLWFRRIIKIRTSL